MSRVYTIYTSGTRKPFGKKLDKSFLPRYTYDAAMRAKERERERERDSAMMRVCALAVSITAPPLPCRRRRHRRAIVRELLWPALVQGTLVHECCWLDRLCCLSRSREFSLDIPIYILRAV